MRLAITNCVALNGGDAAIALALVRALRSSGTDMEVECHDSQPQVASKYYPEVEWRPGVSEEVTTRLAMIPRYLGGGLRRLGLADAAINLAERSLIFEWGRSRDHGRVPNSYRGVDAVVSTGGTYLVEAYDFRKRLFEYQAACRLGIPLVFFTQSLGPFRDPHNRKVLKQIFEDSALVLVRDALSRTHLEDIGVSGERVHVAADGVFAEGERHIEYSPLARSQPLKVGVSVRPYPPGSGLDDREVDRFSSEIARALDHLVRTYQVSVYMVSTCQGISEYWIDDSRLATVIKEKLPASSREAITVDTAFHRPEEFRSIVAGFDLMIAMRMHAAIQSLIMNTPVIPIAYEFKTNELFDRLGMGDFVLDSATVTSAELVDTFERFIGEFDGRRADLALAIQTERASALAGIALVASVVSSVQAGLA